MPESATRAMVEILAEKLVHYRGWTNKILAGASEDSFYRPARWTTCTIGWHMGHLAWKLDSYAEIYLGQPQSLDANWQRRFYSDAPLNPAEAPRVVQLRAVFDGTLLRFMTGVGQLSDKDLLRADPTWPDGTILGAIANVIMHEGEHLAGIEALLWSFKQDDAMKGL